MKMKPEQKKKTKSSKLKKGRVRTQGMKRGNATYSKRGIVGMFSPLGPGYEHARKK